VRLGYDELVHPHTTALLLPVRYGSAKHDKNGVAKKGRGCVNAVIAGEASPKLEQATSGGAEAATPLYNAANEAYRREELLQKVFSNSETLGARVARLLELNRKKVVIPASITDTGVGLRAHGQKGGTTRGKVRHGCRDGNGVLFAVPGNGDCTVDTPHY
jgi:hypothetical protein